MALAARLTDYPQLETLEIVAVNLDARLVKVQFTPPDVRRHLMYDFQTLMELSTTLPAHSPMSNRARATANDIINIFDGSLDSVRRGRALAERVLGKAWEDEYEKDPAKDGERGTLWAIGYCHIDTAWLWPWRATQQKVARSWTSQVSRRPKVKVAHFLARLDGSLSRIPFPSHRCSAFPVARGIVSRRVREGPRESQVGAVWCVVSYRRGCSPRSEVNGACWVEMDGNLPSGESLCRQFLYGQAYFQSRFGKRSDVLVLPDSCRSL